MTGLEHEALCITISATEAGEPKFTIQHCSQLDFSLPFPCIMQLMVTSNLVYDWDRHNIAPAKTLYEPSLKMYDERKTYTTNIIYYVIGSKNL